jgi:hypothetical protein
MSENPVGPESSMPVDPLTSPKTELGTEEPGAGTDVISGSPLPVPAQDALAPIVPASATTTPASTFSRTGPMGKTRSPFGGWLLLIPTLGIYYLFWYHNINRELRDYDPTVEVNPMLAVICLFIPIVGLISIYNTGNRIRQAQATSGGPAESSGVIGLITSIFFALDVPYYSSQLNQVWQRD